MEPRFLSQPGRNKQLATAQVEAVYSTLLSTAVMSVIAGALAISQIPVAKAVVKYEFFSAFTGVFFIRLFLLGAYRRRSSDDKWPWAWLAVIPAVMAALVWGFVSFLVIYYGSGAQVLTITCLTLGGIMMTVMNLSFLPLFLGFVLPVLSMSAAAFMTSGRDGHMQIGIAAGLLTMAIAFSSVRLAHWVTRSMRLAIENEELAVKLHENASALQKTNQELAILSRTDELTGLPNRRHFNEIIKREWARATRTRTSLALLAIDVDHFKRYNDSYGHSAGDLCLQTVSQALGATRSGTDFIARTGGEEFVVLITDVKREEAFAAGERVRHSVLALTTEAAKIYTLPSMATISVGLALTRPSDGMAVEDLIKAADAALYRAKENGRNLVWQDPQGKT